MLTTLQAPNEFHGVQLHIYEDSVATEQLVEVHTIRLEANGSEQVNDEQMALYSLLCSLNAYSFRLPNFTGKLVCRMKFLAAPVTRQRQKDN